VGERLRVDIHLFQANYVTRSTIVLVVFTKFSHSSRKYEMLSLKYLYLYKILLQVCLIRRVGVVSAEADNWDGSSLLSQKVQNTLEIKASTTLFCQPMHSVEPDDTVASFYLREGVCWEIVLLVFKSRSA